MRGAIKEAIASAPVRAKRTVKPSERPLCGCGQLHRCSLCRRRAWEHNRYMRKVGWNRKVILLPRWEGKSRRAYSVSCTCGQCQKCIHREYVQQWRAKRKAKHDEKF